jgi:transposase
LRPHRVKYWLNPKPADGQQFARQVESVCSAYAEAIEPYETTGLHTVCIDEQTGIQALERIAPDIPIRPSRLARLEFEYQRHGTIGLFGNLHVPTGRILAPLLRETRTEEDFLENLDQVVCTDANASWRIICDNLNTYVSESLVYYVAHSCGIKDDLGIKGRRGILQSVSTRRAFLSDLSHRIHFIYLPKHTSWLNQIEIWFGILRRKVIRRGCFPSLTRLSDRILDFIDYYNETMARPFNWTYHGKVLCR